MSVEYNSKLIASLYEENSSKKALEILQEMEEIRDPIFIYPIYSAYKKFKISSDGYDFVVALTSFKTSEAAEILKTIAGEDVSDLVLFALVDFFISIEYFDLSFVEKINSIAVKDLMAGDVDTLTSRFLNYLVKAKAISGLTTFLKIAFENESSTNETREISLSFLLRANPKEYFQYYFDNFSDIKGKKTEITFAKEIRTWSKGLIPQLKDKILKEGSPRAKEIIQEEIDKNKKTETVTEEERKRLIESKYTNADIISSIAHTRAKLNSITSTDSRFDFSLFPPSELIYQQNEAAQSKQALVGYCIELRTFIQQFDDRIISQKYSLEEMSAVIPSIEKPEGSINKLHIFLYKIGIPLDFKLFGLRDINKIISKLAHPEKEDEVINLLKERGLSDLYVEENWPRLHGKILEIYRDVLISMQGALLADRKTES